MYDAVHLAVHLLSPALSAKLRHTTNEWGPGEVY